MNKNKVIILYSSGLDSLVNFYIMKNIFNLEPILLFIDYGQKAKEQELYYTGKLVNKENVQLYINKLDLNVNSKLINNKTDVNINIKDGREAPVDLVPYRNIRFAHEGILLARKLNADYVSFGFNISEAGAYPDNSIRFLDALNNLYITSTYYPYEPIIKFISGSIHFTKTELVLLGKYLNVDFSLSFSCYYPVDNKACGKCNSCRYRIEAFKRAGYEDDIEYIESIDWNINNSDIIPSDRIKILLDILEEEKDRMLNKFKF